MKTKLKPRCFFDIDIGHSPAGRVIFELYNDICPKTTENFRMLCTGEKGVSSTSNKKLHYFGCCFHRVIKGFMIQGGDFVNSDGTGGESIYGGRFEDENFDIPHDKPFLLSMANCGPNSNGSQFFITTKPTPHLDGKHVVFGHVVSGENLIQSIENLPVNEQKKPVVDATITKCGELVPVIKEKSKKKKGREQSAESSSSKDNKKHKKSKKKKKKNKKKSKTRKDSDQENDKNSENDEFPCSVRPDEIPEVPKPFFLYRGNLKEKETKPNQEPTEYPDTTNFMTYICTEDRKTDKFGKTTKGRGKLRYQPSPKERSETPPHWKKTHNDDLVTTKRHLVDSDDSTGNWNDKKYKKAKLDSSVNTHAKERSKSVENSGDKSRNLVFPYRGRSEEDKINNNTTNEKPKKFHKGDVDDSKMREQKYLVGSSHKKRLEEVEIRHKSRDKNSRGRRERRHRHRMTKSRSSRSRTGSPHLNISSKKEITRGQSPPAHLVERWRNRREQIRSRRNTPPVSRGASNHHLRSSAGGKGIDRRSTSMNSARIPLKSRSRSRQRPTANARLHSTGTADSSVSSTRSSASDRPNRIDSDLSDHEKNVNTQTWLNESLPQQTNSNNTLQSGSNQDKPISKAKSPEKQKETIPQSESNKEPVLIIKPPEKPWINNQWKDEDSDDNEETTGKNQSILDKLKLEAANRKEAEAKKPKEIIEKPIEKENVQIKKTRESKSPISQSISKFRSPSGTRSKSSSGSYSRSSSRSSSYSRRSGSSRRRRRSTRNRRYHRRHRSDYRRSRSYSDSRSRSSSDRGSRRHYYNNKNFSRSHSYRRRYRRTSTSISRH